MKKGIQKIIPKLIGKQLNIRFLWAPEKAVKQAFNLFCSPQKGKLKLGEEGFLEFAKQERLLINKHKIQTYYWEGKKETVLLLHGWESNSLRWKSLVKELQNNDYSILAVDAPAQGLSSGKYMNVPLYTECVKDIVEIYKPKMMIGHSLGAMTTIYYQYKYSNKNIEKIIALGPPSELSFFVDNFQKILNLSDKFMKQMDNYMFKNFGLYASQFSISEFAKNVKSKGLLILEKKDKLAPFVHSIKIAKNWTDCELYTVENTGHSLQSDAINQKIMSYLSN